MKQNSSIILKIRKANLQDLPAIKAICDEGIGPDYYSEDSLRKIVESPGEDIYVSTTPEGTVAGFLYIFFSGLGEALHRLSVPEDDPAFKGMDRSMKVGIYKTASTAPEYKSLNICHDLVVYTGSIMEADGAAMILAPGLEDPSGHCFVRGLLEATGSRAVTKVMRPWSGIDCFCPHCRQQYCICDSLIFMKKLPAAPNLQTEL